MSMSVNERLQTNSDFLNLQATIRTQNSSAGAHNGIHMCTLRCALPSLYSQFEG